MCFQQIPREKLEASNMSTKLRTTIKFLNTISSTSGFHLKRWFPCLNGTPMLSFCYVLCRCRGKLSVDRKLTRWRCLETQMAHLLQRDEFNQKADIDILRYKFNAMSPSQQLRGELTLQLPDHHIISLGQLINVLF